uniref:protein ELC-like n=1 Tax=Erigeron canadensis TaxID=72917 RepID=UPI001CB92958|nr:protein ELC-like [Erigeron canadensis]
MASPCHVDFIDNAMFCDTMFALAYTDSDQKWLIREHLLSILREFPSLHPTIDTFIHNDGSTVKLLKVEGNLHISHSLPLTHINIWIHEHYPHVAPIVQVSLDPSNPIRPNHPFVDVSGVTTSSYLHTWSPFGYNLVGLAYNLVRLFSLDHPFSLVSTDRNMCHLSYMSKMECMDRLWWMLHYDIITLSENTNNKIEKLTTLQGEMKMRGDVIDNIITGLEHERAGLKQRVKEMTDEADMLINWLAVNKVNLSVALGGEVEDAFEFEGKDANLVMEGLAEDRALEDLMYAVEKAHEKGAMSHEVYIKQIRVLAKDQFMIRAKLKKLRGPKIFKFLDLIL